MTPQQLGRVILSITFIISAICIPIALIRVQHNYNEREAYNGYNWWLCKLGSVTNNSGTVVAHLFNNVLVQRVFKQHRDVTLLPNETSPVRLQSNGECNCYTNHNYTEAYLIEHKPDVDMTAYIMAETSLILCGSIFVGWLWTKLLCKQGQRAEHNVIVNPTVTIQDMEDEIIN